MPDVLVAGQLLEAPMTAFTLSANQATAISQVKDWFNHRTKDQQVFRVFGYAGAGKTTIVRHAIDELGLVTIQRQVGKDTIDTDDADAKNAPGGVLYAAFTGKAALVMTRKGTPASTIHSLIYRVSEATAEEIERVKKEIAELRAGLRTRSGTERLFEESRLQGLELRLKDAYKPSFVLNDQSLIRDAALIVLDEVSMVGDEMARDLLAFGKPILVLGDPGQLPPIKGEGAFTQCDPDVMLTEIHRQAGESAIIRLATLARQGLPIPYGAHDAFVWKMRRNQVAPDQMLRGGQVICGRNATRFQLNLAMKTAAGFTSPYPSGQGEKIICLKNRNDLGLVNGMFVTLENVCDEDALTLSAVMITEDDDQVGGKRNGTPARIKLYKGHFDDHIRFDHDRSQRDHWEKKALIETTWGWAITCHKSQGSQWENILVWDDGLGRTQEDRNRWLYTAITRAEKGLVILD